MTLHATAAGRRQSAKRSACLQTRAGHGPAVDKKKQLQIYTDPIGALFLNSCCGLDRESQRTTSWDRSSTTDAGQCDLRSGRQPAWLMSAGWPSVARRMSGSSGKRHAPSLYLQARAPLVLPPSGHWAHHRQIQSRPVLRFISIAHVPNRNYKLAVISTSRQKPKTNFKKLME